MGRVTVLAAAVLPVLPMITARAAGSGDGLRSAVVSASASLAIVIGVLRWAPGPDAGRRARRSDDTTRDGETRDGETRDGGVEAARPVAAALLLLLVILAVQLAVLTVGHPSWSSALVGPLASCTLVATYLAAFGLRSTFLLRRLGLLSLLLWAPVVRAVLEVAESSVSPLSDLVYRRLATFGAFGAADHPWRVFSAMTNRSTILVISAVVVGAAVSRRRVTVRTGVETSGAIAAAMVVHHAVVLASPIERYDRPWWTDVVMGPVFELAVGTGAALLAAWMAHRSSSRHGHRQNPGVTAAVGRDPVLFDVAAGDDATGVVRLTASVVPVVVLALVVARELVS